MDWTENEKLAYLLPLPWTIIPQAGDEAGDLVVTCAEIPAAIGAGSNERELETSFWESLRLALRSYLREGDAVPLPQRAGHPLPWESEFRRVTSSAYRVSMTSDGPATMRTADGGVTAGIDVSESERVDRSLSPA